jgi:basic membrane protein A
MTTIRILAVVVGSQQDGGFNETALDGLGAAVSLPGVAVDGVVGATYDVEVMTAAVDEAAARAGAGGVVLFVGGQGDRVMAEAAPRWPDRRFTVIQGSVTGPNMSSVDVRQEQSAYLAGVLAARLTRTGVVGHLSGHRVPPGLRGRAAFAMGVKRGDPAVRLVTAFCGTQDDPEIAGAWTRAEIAEGADIMFTMLNGARSGATAACREAGARQIGNVRDWVATDPAAFVASALARIDLAVLRAVEDALQDRPMGRLTHLGFGEAGDGPPAVGLSMALDVDADARACVAAAEASLRAEAVVLSDVYDGPEFTPHGALA